MPKQNGNPKILAAGAAVQLLTGIPAAWGVFQKPVMAQYGFSRGQAMLSFAILVAGYGIGCAIGGFVQDQHGPRYAALWGTALLGGGSMGAALVPQGNAALFFLVYSIPAGVGSAFLAPAVLACAQKWYASRKGLATGVSGAAMGLSGAFLTVFVGFVEKRWGMRVCFAALGVVVLAVCGASAAVLQNPPQPAGQPNAKAANDLPPHQMVRTTQYRLCVAGVALAAPPMLLFSPEILTIAADRGLPEQWAPLCVADISVAGRVAVVTGVPRLYGAELRCTDLRGGAALCVAALAAGSIGFAFAQGWWVLAAYCVLTCFYSGGAAVQPALNTDLFGLAHAGVNYGLIALGMSAGSLLSYAGSQLLDLPARHMLAVASAVAGGIFAVPAKAAAQIQRAGGHIPTSAAASSIISGTRYLRG